MTVEAPTRAERKRRPPPPKTEAHHPVVTELERRGFFKTPVEEKSLATVWESAVGERVDLELPGITLKGSVDSTLIRRDVRHLGILLDGGIGRAVLTLVRDDRLAGHVFFEGESFALTFSGSLSAGGWKVTEDRYHHIVCSREGGVYQQGAPSDPLPAEFASHESGGGGGGTQTVPILNSRPGADHVIYLDFDGETIAHPYWKNGATIVAAAHERHGDPQWVTLVWRRAAEDWAPFEINITTDRGLYDNAPLEQRMHCIITPTKDAAPGSGGVAYRDSYTFDIPCWAFNGSEYPCADTISHEVGHTMGLYHHGLGYPEELEYYGGHGTGDVSWAPIMGAAWADPTGQRYLENVTQWSHGEYDVWASAYWQDDLATISREANGFGYRLDDTGSSMAGAESLHMEGNTVEDSGVIERTSDEDWFEFHTAGGMVELFVETLDVMSAYEESGSGTAGANLAVDLRLYDSGGSLVETSNPADVLDASIVRSLAAGTYFLRIAGAGRGDASTGFTDYGSLGQYEISGTIPAGVSAPEIRVTGNGVRVLDGSATPSRGNGTDFGRVDYILGHGYDQEFVIENQGGQALAITSISADSPRYALVGELPSSIPAESAASFTLRYTPVGEVVDLTTVTIVNGDSDEGEFDFAVTGEGIQGVFDDEYEENDSLGAATDLSADERTTITARQADDDWYKIHVTTGFTRVVVELDFIHAEGDIDLSLHNAAGAVLAASAGAADGESIDVDVGAGGDYYLRVYYDDAWNLYDLWWDDLRPNLNPDIELRGGGSFEYTIENGADVPGVLDGTDFGATPVTGGVIEKNFRIVNVGRGPLTIESVSTSSSWFSVTSAPPGTLGSDFQATLTVRFDPATIGDHAAVVTIESDDSDDDPFTFAVRGVGTEAVVDDDYEENDTLGSAFNLASHGGSWISTLDGPGVQSDDDWYEIAVPAGMNRVRVDCQFTHELGDIDIELLDAGGFAVASSTGVNDNETIDTELAPGGGTYFIRVYYGNAGNAYDLKWEADAPDAPDIALFGGAELDVGIADGDVTPSLAEGTDFGNLNIHGESFSRTFLVRNTGNGTLSVASVVSDSAEFEVLPGFPTSVIPGGGEVFHIRFDPSSAGIRQAVITVTSNDPDQGSYGFLVEGTATDGVPDDPYEENNSAATAFNLTAWEQTWISTILGPGRQFDPDWYRVDVAPNHDRLSVNCAFTHAGGDIDMNVYDASLLLLKKANSSTDNEQLLVDLPSHGTYYIAVYGYGSLGDTGNSYDLRWNQIPAPDDPYEDNDVLAEAYDLTGHERNWISNLDGLGRQADEDWYRFDVTSGYDEVRVNCEFVHAHGDIDISLHDASGTYLAGSNGTSDNESIVHTVSSGATYYVRVYYGNANNVYDLWWDDLVPGTAAPLMLVTGSSMSETGEGADADDDGRLDPGETVLLDVELENRGTLAATGVIATLTTTDPRVTSITEAIGDYGDLNVRRSDSWTYGFTVDSTAGPGTIQFDLAVVSNEGTWNRTIQVDLTDGDDGYEQNDTQATAYDLRGRTWIDDANQKDSDWYLIGGTTIPRRLHLNCLFVHDEGDINLELYRSSGQFVAGSYSTDDNEYIAMNIPAGEEYYVHVFHGNQGNAYELRWSYGFPALPKIGVLDYREDDVIPHGDVSPSKEDGTDFARVEVLSGVVTHGFVVTNEGNEDLIVSDITVDHPVFGVSHDLTSPITPGSTGAFQVTFEPVAAGSFGATVSISSNDPDKGTFTFAVAGVGVTDDAYEENDSQEAAYDLRSAKGQWISEIAGEGIALDHDFYQVEVNPEFRQLKVECDFLHAAGDIELLLWDEAGNVVVSSESSDDDEEIVRIVEPGIYFVHVVGLGDSGNNYDLRWNLLDADLDDDGLPNDWEVIYSGSETGMDPLGNPDGDPFPHWAEYALKLDPTQFSNPTLVEVDDYPYFGFEWNPEATALGYRYQVLAGPDLVSMSEDGAVFSHSGFGPYEDWVIYKGVEPVTNSDAYFFRLGVVRPGDAVEADGEQANPPENPPPFSAQDP